MPSTPEELEEALKTFRLDILKALADIDAHLSALRAAVLESKGVSPKRLDELEMKASESLSHFLDGRAQTISQAHEVR
jgi:hypothetical protein